MDFGQEAFFNVSEEKQKVKCPKCDHKFLTKSKLLLISCNSCGSKFKREENIVRGK